MRFTSHHAAIRPRVSGSNHRQKESGRRVSCSSAFSDSNIALGFLGLEPGATKKEIRAAYIDSMKSLHPDVSQLDTEEATVAATQLNLAYEAALLGLTSGSRQTLKPNSEVLNVYDRTIGAADQLFVNPFACNADPMLWRELQQAAQEAESPEDGLLARGVYAGPSALQYVTREQLMGLYAELEEMEMSFQFEAASWMIDSLLARAYRANRRQA